MNIPHTPSGGLDRGRLVAVALAVGSVTVAIASAQFGTVGETRASRVTMHVLAAFITFPLAYFGWRSKSPWLALFFSVLCAPIVASPFAGGLALPFVLGIFQVLLLVPALRLARWSTHDARDHRIVTAAAWTAAAGLLALVFAAVRTGVRQTSVAPPMVPGIAVAVMVGAFCIAFCVRLRMRARVRWVRSLATSAVGGWTIVSRRGEAGEAVLQPLFAGTTVATCQRILVRLDAAPPEAPYREGPIETPIALVP